MIYPIVAYGDPVLRKKATDIPADYPKLKELLENMWETMYDASGVGLAAPQIGKPVRIFLVDTTPFADDPDLSEEEQKQLSGFKKAFINAHIVEEKGDEWSFNEGCLSIPNVREDVFRQEEVLIDKKTAIIGINHNVSILKDISIYTYETEVPLKEVFQKIAAKESEGPAINHKVSKNELQSYFSEVLPNYDEERVYASDIKKVVQWYNLLQSNDMLQAIHEEE